MKNLAIFASGTGSNFEAIANAVEKRELNANIVLLVCDNPKAAVIDKAQSRGIEVLVFNPKEFESKNDYEMMIINKCKFLQIDLIALAGYMRILSKVLLAAYPKKIVNIHPSLLPAFKGKDAVQQAIDYGVKIMGITIHYVDEGIDTGEIINQKAFEINNEFTRSDIEIEIHKLEHSLYVETLKVLLEE